MDAAAHHSKDGPLLQALAAWHLARAANEWARPDLAAEALGRASSIFADLKETGWLAACDWQRNALPWTRPNFPQAAADLAQAVNELDDAKLNAFVPHCRLALAYAQLLTGQFASALENIKASESAFAASGDLLSQARCWLTRSSILRRQDKLDQSWSYLRQALERFQQFAAPVKVAETHYQLGYYAHFARSDYAAAQEHFQEAKETFIQHQMPLWVALCDYALSQVHMETGELVDAASLLNSARECLARFNITGAQGDVLLDSAKYERVIGAYEDSARHLQRAEQLYNQVGAPLMGALAAVHLGSTYRDWGFHQRALHHLERAQQHLQGMNSPGRLAECNMRLAHVWLELNRPEKAESCLSRAASYYEQVQRPAYLVAVYGRQAEIAMRNENTSQASVVLEKAIAIAREHNLRTQLTITQRLLGECLLLSGKLAAGQKHLEEAAAEFAAMGLLFDQAGCLVALGNGLRELGQGERTRQCWQEALDLNQETVPALTWKARAGLARLAESEGDSQEALVHYQKAVKALNRQRHDFWQPELAGAFLQRASDMVDQAVRLAIKNNSHQDALHFVEAGKAQTLARRLLHNPRQASDGSISPEVAIAAADIQFLYERMHAGYQRERAFQDAHVTELKRQLPQRIKAYRDIRSKGERQQLHDDVARKVGEGFSVDAFRKVAAAQLDKPWLAASYHLTADSLYSVLLSESGCSSWQRNITPQFRRALDTCVRARRSGHKPTPADLAVLGQWLIPEEMTVELTPDTMLLLAPQGELHQIPWSAILPGVGRQPLVARCMPAIVPSLFCLMLLWQRQTNPLSNGDGLLLGVSAFPGRPKPPLPQVNGELARIAAQSGKNRQATVIEDATWDKLCALAEDNGLARYAFCHIASHASFDPLTGRLSTVSFYDRDVWLDELWDCAPWPSLVTLAACTSSQNLVHEGDEHVGLTTTFLAAGADTVVGTLWKVEDEDAAALLSGFYNHFLAGHSPAAALALVQRQAVQQGEAISRWGGFICVGMP